MVASQSTVVGPGTWVLLTYKLPRDPSTPRSSVWRKLRRHGALQLADGLVALPADARTREALEWIADEVIAAHGTAMIWTAQPGTLGDERQLAQQMSAERTTEYADLASRAQSALTSPAAEQRRALRTLRTELRAIRRRDHFAADGRQVARDAVEQLATSTASANDSEGASR